MVGCVGGGVSVSVVSVFVRSVREKRENAQLVAGTLSLCKLY